MHPSPCSQNGWHSVVDTRGSGGHGRHPGARHHRGRVLSRRRVLMALTAAALLLLFVGARQSPRPEWQGFVSVRGLHVSCADFLCILRGKREENCQGSGRSVRGTCNSMLHVICHEPSLWKHVASKVEQPGVLQRLHVTDLLSVFWQDA